MLNLLRSTLVILTVMTLLTGAVYPVVVTGIAQAVFPGQANGSLVLRNGRPVGSALLGQQFDDPRYFWGRLSATAGGPCNGLLSSGSNLGPLNPALVDAARARLEALRAADPHNRSPVPIDLVTASGSGLDPDITPAAAEHQIARVARARGLAPAMVRDLVARHSQGRQMGLLGEERVNVLRLNLALDQLPQ